MLLSMVSFAAAAAAAALAPAPAGDGTDPVVDSEPAGLAAAAAAADAPPPPPVGEADHAADDPGRFGLDNIAGRVSDLSAPSDGSASGGDDEVDALVGADGNLSE